MSLIITTSSSGMIINGQSYPKGSVRPFYTGDYVDLMFPWWNNQPISGIPTGSVKWSNITANGLTFSTKAAWQAFFDQNMTNTGPLSVPATQFTIGDGQPGTPANGSDTYYNPKVTTESKVSQNGVGFLTWGVDITFVTGGGFQLIGATAPFATSQTFIVFF